MHFTASIEKIDSTVFDLKVEVEKFPQMIKDIQDILKDKKKILPCATFLQGEYGIEGLFVGVPVKLGARGVEEIIQIELTADEQAALQKSADAVKELVDIINV